MGTIGGCGVNYLYTTIALFIALLILLSCSSTSADRKAIQVQKITFINQNNCYRINKDIWSCDGGYYIELKSRFKEIRGGR